MLEFCLVFCAVSAVTQSSLWSLKFALDSCVLPCPRLWPWLWVRGHGEGRSWEPPSCSLVLGRLCLELGGGQGVRAWGRTGTLGCPALTSP